MAAAPATLLRTSRRELALSAVQAEAEAERRTMAAVSFMVGLWLFVSDSDRASVDRRRRASICVALRLRDCAYLLITTDRRAYTNFPNPS